MEAVSLLQRTTWSYVQGAEVNESLYLLPGALYMGNEVREVKTLLGSCVAVTLWHPEDKVCAMTHIVLPSGSQDMDNPKYATGAIQLLLATLEGRGYQAKEFETGIYGGGRMFATGDSPGVIDVGNSNVKKTVVLLKEAGFKVSGEDVLGDMYRHILLDRTTGSVKVKRTEVSSTMG